MSDQAAMASKRDWFGDLEVSWMKQPDHNTIKPLAREGLQIPDDSPCEAVFIAEGAFHKVYRVQCGSHGTYIVRVAVPLCPRHKMLGEVTTMKYVQSHTDVPVPLVSCWALRHRAIMNSASNG